MISLANIFVGFVKGYRSLGLRYDPRYESMARWTGAEVGWFAELGENLGFSVVIEKQVFPRRNPVDLAWVDPVSRQVVLHLERENVPGKISETLYRKLLPRDAAVAQFIIVILDELPDDAFAGIEAQAISAFEANEGCAQFLAICYSDIPPRSKAKHLGVPRYWMEWPVRGLHLVRGNPPSWLEARCTTDKNYMYTMYMVSPAPAIPNERQRWGTKAENAQTEDVE